MNEEKWMHDHGECSGDPAECVYCEADAMREARWEYQEIRARYGQEEADRFENAFDRMRDREGW